MVRLDDDWFARSWLSFLSPSDRRKLCVVSKCLNDSIIAMGFENDENISFTVQATTKHVDSLANAQHRPVCRLSLDFSESWRVTTKSLVQLLTTNPGLKINSIVLGGVTVAHSSKLVRALRDASVRELVVHDASGLSVSSSSSCKLEDLERLALYNATRLSRVHAETFATSKLKTLTLTRAVLRSDVLRVRIVCVRVRAASLTHSRTP